MFNQSTHYKDRVYLYLKKERALLVKLLTGDISMEEFTLTDDIKTENGVMILNLVKYLKERFIEEIPLPYLGFLKNISKNSSARSLVQVNDVEVLEDLSNYCIFFLDCTNKLHLKSKHIRRFLFLPILLRKFP